MLRAGLEQGCINFSSTSVLVIHKKGEKLCHIWASCTKVYICISVNLEFRSDATQDITIWIGS